MSDYVIRLWDGGPLCSCGCNEPASSVGKFRPGHDAKLKTILGLAHKDGNDVVLIDQSDVQHRFTAMELGEFRGWGKYVESIAVRAERKQLIAQDRKLRSTPQAGRRVALSDEENAKLRLATVMGMKRAKRILRENGISGYNHVSPYNWEDICAWDDEKDTEEGGEIADLLALADRGQQDNEAKWGRRYVPEATA